MSQSLGESFQEAREAKGLTLDEAAARTRILPHYLKAVEDNNYAKLPDEVFAKGFVRSYARLLALDEALVIKQFDESGGQFYAKRNERESLKQKLEEEERQKKVTRNIVVGMVCAVVFILFVLVGRGPERPDPPMPVPAAPAPAPASLAPMPDGDQAVRAVVGQSDVERNFSVALPLEGVIPDGTKKLILDVEALERCWVQVQADQAPMQEVLLNPGDRTRWNARERVTLTLGNAGGVRVFLNGKLQEPFGGRGQVIREIVFTP